MLVADVLPKFISDEGMLNIGPLLNLNEIVGMEAHGAVQ